MEDELLNTPVIDNNGSNYENFKTWAEGLGNQGLSKTDLNPNIQNNQPGNNFERFNKSIDPALALAQKASGIEDTSKYSYETKNISKRYPKNFLGINNEEVYAQNQSTSEKAYNGVVKMTGIATTTFVNGTAGLVYGITKAAEEGKLSSFYNNDLTNWLNDVNNGMEDSYAHYKTEREIKGDWWEPSNLITANFFFDNVVKNLGFSLGAAAAGFAWGGALKAIGLTGKLIGTGEALATEADAAIAKSLSLPQVERLSYINNELNGLWNTAKSKIGAGLMKTDRAIVATFGTFGESGMEALNNSQEFRKNMINEFTQTHGYAPTGEDLKQINEHAESVGNWSFGLNTALLTATNYIQLPKIYSSSFKAEKEILNNVALQGEKYASTLPTEGFGKLFYKAKNVAGLFVNKEEGFEEGAQFAIQTGTQNYFDRKYKNKKTSALDDGLLYGVKQALTTGEGTLNIFTGAFSGALQSSGIIGVKKNEQGNWRPTIGGTGKIGERGLTGYGGTEATFRDEAVSALNNSMIKSKLKDAYLNVVAAESIQQDRENAIRQGDILESKDLEFDYAHNFITTRLKYNAKGAVDNEIDDLKQQAITDFGTLQQQGIATTTDTKESFIKRLDNIKTHADSTAKMYDALNLKYKGLVNKETGERVYTDEVIDQLVYAGAKIMDYDARIPQLNTELAKSNINTLDILSSIINNEVPSQEAIAKGVEDIKALKSINEEDLILNLKDLVEVSLRRKQFIEEYNDIKAKPQNFTVKIQEPTITDVEGNVLDENGDVIPKETISVKTKYGQRDIEIGSEYVLGKVIEYDSKGKEVYRQPRLTILGKNEDGTIKIKTSNGNIKDVSEIELESYSLTKADKLTLDKKFNFFEKNQNTIYKHYGIKDKQGNPVVGRLEYNSNKDRLTFVYVDSKGVVKKREVWNTMFKAKEGFKQAMLSPMGTLTAIQEKASQEFIKDKTSISQKLQTRNNIITDLYNNGVKRVEEINKKLEGSQEKLSKAVSALEEQLAKESLTKAGTKRKNQTPAMKRIINELSSLHIAVTKENNELQNEKEELENNIPFFKDFLDNLESLPEAGSEMIKQLKDDINTLEDLINITNEAIKSNDSILKQIEEALLKAVSIFNDFIKRLQEENKGVPLFIEDLQSNLEKVLGENGAQYFIDNKQGITSQVIELESDINDFSEELKIPALNKQAESIVETIKELQAGLDKLINEQIAKQDILNAFKQYAELQEQIKAESDRLQRNEELNKQFIGQLSNATQNFFGTKPYEAASKKTDLQVVNSTRPIDDGKPHQQRTNYFGNKLHTFKNKNSIKAVIVTPTTELGFIDGLTEHFLSDVTDEAKLENFKKEAIFLVMVDSNGKPVDKEGVTIPEGSDLLNNAIYQVFPAKDLISRYKNPKTKKWVEDSMFREGIDEEEKTFLTQKYEEWRKDQLAQTTLGAPQDFDASFGIPELVQKWDDTVINDDDSKGAFVTDNSARTSVVSAGLITTSNLRQNKVIDVPTTGNAVTEGSVVFNAPKGRVFLRIPGVGIAKLNNRKFNAKEASTIFDVMLQITKNVSANGKIGAESTMLFNWLKSVSYWGIAKYPDGKRKAAGYNNIWFEKDETGLQKLYISGINKDSKQAFDFTPAGLNSRKEDIVYLLQQLYNNTDASRVNDNDKWNSTYNQIVGINTDGTPNLIEWPNYQTYLLSDKAPDASGKLTLDRNSKELPLATNYQPLTETKPTNRKAVYFTIKDNSEFYTLPVKEEVEEIVVTDPAKPIAQVTPKTFVLDGTTNNQIVSGTGKLLVFKASEKGEVTIQENESSDFINAVMVATNATKEDVIEKFKTNLENQVTKQIEETPKVIVKPSVPVAHTLDGQKNTITTGSGKSLVFIANKQGVVTINEEDSKEFIDTVMVAKNLSKEDVIRTFKLSLEAQIAPQVVASQIPVEPATEEVIKNIPNTFEEDDIPEGDIPDKSVNYRLAAVKKATQFQKEDWGKVEAFVKANFPNVPFYRVKNMIQATNGRQAWGMLHDAAIYVYENAEEGTAYHEVFEGVWKMFAGPKEKQTIINEFNNRQGSYVDRVTGETIEYNKATPAQLKEELAEEFKDFVLTGKQVERKQGTNLISRLFRDLVNFIKEFFTGKQAINNTQQLFNKIGNGYYKQYNPYSSNLAYAKKGIINIDNATASDSSELRVESIPETQLHDILQQMTYSTLADLVASNKSLFTIENINKTDLYTRLKAEILNFVASERTILKQAVANKETTVEDITPKFNNLTTLYKNIQAEWEGIVKDHKIQLKAYNVEFDENDDVTLTDENNSGKGEFDGADKIDSFRKANAAIKLLLGTLPEMEIVDGKSQYVSSTIGGRTLMAADKVYIDLVSKLHSFSTIEDMFEELRKLSLTNKNYALLYSRMTNAQAGQTIDWGSIENHDWQIMSAFWKAIKKQNADIVTVFVLSSGEVVISDSTLSGAAKQAKREMINNISDTMKNDATSYFHYDKVSTKYYATTKIKNYKFDVRSLNTYTDFLKEIGIDFDLNQVKNKLNGEQRKLFIKSVDGIYKSLSVIGDEKIIKDDKGNPIKTDSGIFFINTKTLDIDGQLSKLAVVKAVLESPDFESTYFNINGEKSQTFIGTNLLSDMFDVFSKLNNFNDLVSTPFKHVVTDSYSKGSVLLSKMFDMHIDGDGGRIENTNDLLRPTLIDGTNNEETGKKKQSSKLSFKERLTQEINLNLSGVYSNLVPGDASLEYAIKMHDEKSPFVNAEEFSTKKYLEIFKNYFLSEIELSREERYIPSVKGRSNKDLRFFKAILGEELHSNIIDESFKKVNKSFKNTPEEVYKTFDSKINNAVTEFIKNEAKDTRQLLDMFGIIENTEDGLKTKGLLLGEEGIELDEDILNDKLNLLSVNYIIANIEMHKLIYSDPYQYKDELKRIKNFNSPGQPLVHGSSEVNSTFDRLYNQDKGYVKGDIGHSDMFRDHFRAITMEDVLSVNDLQDYDEPYEEPDGGGYVTLQGTRKFKLRDGSWTENNERQYIYDVAFEKTIKGEKLTDKQKQEKGLILTELEKEIYSKGNPQVKNTYTPLKPIVRGSKDNGRNYNDMVLHKFALVPLSFRVLYEINPTSNAIKLYNKMQAEDIDYGVYASGSKVGSEKVSPLYNEDGTFNETPFQSQEELKGKLNTNDLRAVSNIPFSIVAVQSEVPSKDVALVTQGSQITKLVTMDFLEAGMPVDFMKGKEFDERFAQWLELKDKTSYNEGVNIYNAIQHNQALLEARIEEGYNTLLKKLGLKETILENGKKVFDIKDREKLVNTLQDEILKRETNYNILDAFEGFKKMDVVLEATSVYQQIRNILYSIADKNVVRPKISGGMKVQIPSTLLESVRAIGKPVFDKKGKQVFREDGSPKLSYESDNLKFYKNKDGERVCEIMIGRWFKSNKSDAELIDYFNNDPEGKKEFAAITGVAFRIPTQKQNSIDVFRIKKFLPKEFGDSVVIPSALVKKVGSDFDIDKLSIYLKNLFTDSKGNLKVVPYYGIGQNAKDKFYELFDNGSLLSKAQVKALNEELALSKSGVLESKLIESIFGDAGIFTDEDIIEDFIQDLTDKGIRDSLVDKMYKSSLENEYIQSLENLVSHELNFENLVKPNDASSLKKLSEDIQEQMGNEKIDYSSVGNMISRKFMTGLRQAFVAGKQGISIAAVGQTGYAQRQRTPTYIDTDILQTEAINETDKKWLGNGLITFEEYNSAIIDGKVRPVLSFIKNKAKEYISDINGMFIDGYVDISKGPWIMELGATPNVTSTWLFLIDLGVPINTIGYFINQPIVKDYLRTVENRGYSWLFIDNIMEEMIDVYSPKNEEHIITKIPSESQLWDMLPYNKTDIKFDMSDLQKAQQQFILKEFLKYAKMASHVFEVTQGSNFDTANINDSSLVFKKKEQLKKARKTIISSVDNILKSSFVGSLKEFIYDYKDAFSEILISDKKRISSVLEEVFMPYINMSDRDFVKMAQKARFDLFSWAVQTSPEFVQNISTILLGTETESSTAKQIIDFKDSIIGNKAKGIKANPEHPLYTNIILNAIKSESAGKGKVDNLYLAGNTKTPYDQNLTIYGFNELRNYLKSNNKDLYTKLVRLAVLQSGLTNSKIAFTNLLPYNDFKDVYNNALSNLENLPNLAAFSNLNVFERNNWNNTDVVEYKKARKFEKKAKPGDWFYPELILDKKLSNAIEKNIIPKMISISPYTAEGRADFITYSWEDSLPKQEKALRRKTENYSHVHKVLMQKIYTTDDNGNRVPYIEKTPGKNSKGQEIVYEKYLYKAINAWGDSFRAQEFYDTAKPSVLDNGYEKVNEVEDNLILNILGNKQIIQTVDNKTTIQMQPQNVEKILNGTKTTTIRESIAKGGNIQVGETKVVNFGGKDFNVTNRGHLTITEAGGVNQILQSEGLKNVQDFMYQQSKNWANGKGKMYVFDIIPTKSVSEKPEGITLKDGNTYTENQLNTKMLLAMGYTLIEAGEIIKNNKC